MNKILVFIPTYDEVDNVANMCEQIMALPIDCDLHFIDDGSPDGTGAELERLAQLYPRVTVGHRSGKLGIGSAHQEGIAYAYRKGYDILITMDCDFTHDPARIPDLLRAHENNEVILGSRYLASNSLPGWSLHRRFLTNLGHFLTRHLLRIRYDATGAFRLYDLKKIPHALFKTVRSRSYSFFFESVFLLSSNGVRIREIPVVLPSRTYGHSKLSIFEAVRSAMFLLRLSVERIANPGRFQIGRDPDLLREDLHDPQDWAPYWQQKKEVGGFIYETIAAFYRNLVIRPVLHNALGRHYSKGSNLLHAGCGSGQVDLGLQECFRLTAVDISSDALDLYSRYNPKTVRIEQASILDLPYPNDTFDGVYNLGVMEHFTDTEIVLILLQFQRVLKPGGKVLLFWPHRHGLSVLTLKTVRWLARTLWKKELKFHPDEISLLTSTAQAKRFFAEANLELLSCRMSLRDGYVQAILVGQKPA